MRTVTYSLVLASSLMIHSISGAELPPETLDGLLDKVKTLNIRNGAPLDSYLKGIKDNYRDIWEKLCIEINKDIEKKGQPHVGNLRAATIGRWCAKQDLDQNQYTKKIQPKAPATSSTPTELEKVKLRPVELKTGAKGFEAQQKQLKDNEENVRAHLLQLDQLKDKKIQEKRQQYEHKLSVIKKEIEDARQYYDNLSIAIISLRADFDEIGVLKSFNNDHRNDDPEAFLNAFSVYQSQNPNIKNYVQRLEQVDAAHQELKKALAAQRKGEEELGALIKQMEIDTSHL